MSDTKYFLQGRSKGDSPLVIPLDKRETLIGRSKDCTLILQAPSVSRKHSVIRIAADNIYLSDLGSRNGSYINGVKIEEECLLRSGDIIRLGEIEFTFQAEQSEGEYDDESEKTQIDIQKQQESSFVKQFNLSAREEEVFYLLIKGLKIKEISTKLFISQGTAKNHVLSIYSKTDCHSRIELAQKYQNF